jgi:hypothetical protein
MISKEHISFDTSKLFPECNNCPSIQGSVETETNQLIKSGNDFTFDKAKIELICIPSQNANPNKISSTVTVIHHATLYWSNKAKLNEKEIIIENVKCPGLVANRRLTNTK